MLLSALVAGTLYVAAAAAGIGLGFVELYHQTQRRGDLPTQTIADLCQHGYVRGANGTGKSTLLAHWFQDGCRHGNGVWWISTHNSRKMLDLVPESRSSEVVYIAPADPRPLGFNLFRRYTQEAVEVNLIADQTTRLFSLLFRGSWGDRIDELVNVSTLALLDYAEETEEEVTLFELYRMLADSRFRQRVLSHVRHLGIAEVFTGDRDTPNTLARTAAKIRRSVTNDVLLASLGQRDGLDLRRLVDQRAIVIADFDEGRLGPGTARFFAETLLSKLQMVGMSRPESAPLVRVFADEFQTYPTPAFGRALTELRKHRIAVTLAHQEAGQLPKELWAAVLQTGSRVYFRQSPLDGPLAAKDFPKGQHDAEFLANLPNYVFVAKMLSRGRLVYTMGRGAPWPESTGQAESILARCQGPAREAILAEIAGRGQRDAEVEEVDTSGVVIREFGEPARQGAERR